MFVMIDNYDSFVHNLAVYLRELGQEVRLIRNDQVDLSFLFHLHQEKKLDGILLSPGPKSPQDCGQCLDILKKMAGLVPVLGICLGHQNIGHAWKAQVVKGERPMHGKVSLINNCQKRMFRGLPAQFFVTRYHSLVISPSKLPDCLSVDARSEDGAIMAVSHRTLPVYGIQFHPEAVMTEYGHQLLGNFITLCEEWRNRNENPCPGTALL